MGSPLFTREFKRLQSAVVNGYDLDLRFLLRSVVVSEALSSSFAVYTAVGNDEARPASDRRGVIFDLGVAFSDNLRSTLLREFLFTWHR